jgi:glycosyltransferase involved in cell wall biosynthesis
MQSNIRGTKLPTISIVIPTLNSERTLKECLESIVIQDYPKDKIEIIIADGGSIDKTLNIIENVKKMLSMRVIPNKLKTGEAGKAVGLKYTKNEIIAFIDSDNILLDKDWLTRMIEPFYEPDIVASEPIEYTYRKSDGYITRYCALLGMNDPLCLFLGNYDRHCTLTGLWTEIQHKEEDKGGYLKIELNKESLPTIGANGFFIYRSALEKCNICDYLFDIDVIYELLNSKKNTTTSPNSNPIQFAKVKTGIIHIFSGDMKTFARKQKRRVRDYIYYNKLGARKYPWKKVDKIKLLEFILSCIFVIPLLIQCIKGYRKKTDEAWFFHPIACWLTLWEYGWGRIGGVLGVKELERERWGNRA